MARAPNEKAEKAKQLYKQGMKLVDIATKLEVPAGTVRRWKSTYCWNSERSELKSERSEKKREQSKNKIEVIAKEVEEVIENPNLTDKQRLFCLYYIKQFNATKAYQKAYKCNYETAMVRGSETLRNIKVKEEIKRLKQERLNREFLSESDIFQKYIDIAFADITDFTEFGNEERDILLDTGEQKTIKVSHVNIKKDTEVDGTLITEVSKGKDGVKVKLADRMKALQWLTDHMDLATEKQKAEIAALKAKVQLDNGNEIAEDGFIEALNGFAKDDWSDEEDS